MNITQLVTGRGVAYVVAETDAWIRDRTMACKSIGFAQGEMGLPSSYVVELHDGTRRAVYDFVEVHYLPEQP